jgi:hypothetical protein
MAGGILGVALTVTTPCTGWPRLDPSDTGGGVGFAGRSPSLALRQILEALP